MSNKLTREKKERMAEVLVDSFLSRDDRKTAERYGITDRTLRNWRSRLDKDPELSELFRQKKATASEGWADEVPGAMKASVSFLRRAAEQGDPRDSEMVHSVAGAMKMLSEVAATWKLLEARLDRNARTQPQAAAPDQRASSLPN